MFWKYNQTSPQIDTVLFKEDTTLNEVLDQENVLQELKSQNKKLIEFITRADILNQLVGFVTEEPSEELEEHEKYRRPNLACEVLTTDIPILNERLSDKALLTKLYSFLEGEPPLNPLLASFFSRTLSMLICRKADQHWYSYQFTCLQVLDFLKTKENSLNLLLKHLDTSAIMDFTFKLITQIEGNEMQQNLISWLESEELIENIIELFDPNVDEGRHYNAAQLLCDTIRKCREINERNDLGPILSKIQSPEMIKKMLDKMLSGEHVESSIVGGISVLLTLLEPPPNTDQLNRRGAYNNIEDSGSGEPPPTPNPALPSIISSILPYLPALHNLLINPPQSRFESYEAFETLRFELPSYAPIQSPLGNTRLTVIKFISALIATNTPEVNEALNSLDTVHVLLDLFFHYTWNNFLHSQVDRCLAFALNAGPESSKNPLIPNIFIKCRLLQRILEAWKENENEQNKVGGKRRGYMGHLTNIANSVIKQEDLTYFINENIDQETVMYWEKFVENTLQPINVLHQQFLGGKHPAHINNKDDDLGYRDANFSTESINQSISEFGTNAALTSNFIENFASFDDGKTSNSQDDSDNDQKAEMFKKICSQKKGFEDMETTMEEEDSWDYNLWNNSEDHSSSSDEDDKILTNPKEKIDSAGALPLVEQVDPWSESKRTDNLSNEEGWADFTSFDVQFETVPESPKNDNKEPDIASAIQSQQTNKGPFNLEESCNSNINANDLVLEDVLPEEDLIDNFRFLSIQGMISEKENTNAVSEDSKAVKNIEEESKESKHKESRTPCEAHEADPV